MATASIPLPAAHDLEFSPGTRRIALVIQTVSWFCATGIILAVAALDLDVAMALVDDLGAPLARHALFVPLALAFGFAALAAGFAMALEEYAFILMIVATVAALFLAQPTAYALAGGVPALRAAHAQDPAATPRHAGWAYVVAAAQLHDARKSMESKRAAPAPALLDRVAPLPSTTPPLEVILAAASWRSNPPLLGEQARRFAMSAQILGYLDESRARTIYQTRFVPAKDLVAARSWAESHVPGPGASALAQRAWLRLVGEQKWSRSLAEEADQ